MPYENNCKAWKWLMSLETLSKNIKFQLQQPFQTIEDYQNSFP